MSWNNRQNELAYEKNIVWLKLIKDYRFVRESWVDFCETTGIPPSRLADIESEDFIVVGYAELEDDAPPAFVDGGKKYFYRRIFKIRRGDFEAYSGDNAPGEAVDPLTVEPKVQGLSPSKKCQISVRVPRSLFARLNSYIQRNHQPLTDVVVHAITQYLDTEEPSQQEQQPSVIARLLDLERRVAHLEAKG